MREWVSINGRLLPADQAQVSVFDSAFMQGVGLFSTMRAYNGCVPRMDRHLARLHDSAVALGWTLLPETDVMRAGVEQVLAATEQADARVRLTVTTGSLRAGADAANGLTIVANASPGTPYQAELYRRGVTVLISKYAQSAADPTAGHKTTSYFARLAALREAHTKHAFESLWLTPEDLLAEGCISNIFLVKDGELRTPRLDTPILPGITRGAILELAGKRKIAAREMDLSVDDLRSADEVFLTNSLIEVLPVVRIDREPIGTEKVGDATRELYEAYGELVERECGEG